MTHEHEDLDAYIDPLVVQALGLVARVLSSVVKSAVAADDPLHRCCPQAQRRLGLICGIDEAASELSELTHRYIDAVYDTTPRLRHPRGSDFTDDDIPF